jgi:hypothetical protein
MIIKSMTFCVFLKMSFIRKCKNNFFWLLIMEKIKDIESKF